MRGENVRTHGRLVVGSQVRLHLLVQIIACLPTARFPAGLIDHSLRSFAPLAL
jgi:hypothetical protein